MTGLERVVTILDHKEADRVPCSPLICYAAHRVYGIRCDEMAMEGELAGKAWVSSQHLVGFDAYCLLLDLTLEAHDFGQDTEFLLNDVTRPNYNNPMIPDKDSYHLCKPIEACVTKGPGGFSRMAEYIKTLDIIMNETGHDTAVVSFVFGTLGLLGMLRGAEKLFFDCVKNPEPVMKAQDVICDVICDYVKKQADTGVHGICIDTLYASGGIMSGKLWNKVEAATSKKICDAFRDKTGVWIHNCGNDVYFKEQHEAMNCVGMSYAYIPKDCDSFAEAKEKWGNEFTLFGYVHPAERLFLGTKQELLDECKIEIDTNKKDGGFILASGCEFPPNANLNMAVAMMEAAELHGQY